jgi:hypothetical protein
MRIWMLALCGVLISGSAASQNVFVIGDGTKSCGAWTADRSNDVPHNMELDWVLGFISGSNWENPQSQARFADNDAIAAYVDNYCALNPLHGIAAAAAAIVQEGGGPQATHTWKR